MACLPLQPFLLTKCFCSFAFQIACPFLAFGWLEPCDSLWLRNSSVSDVCHLWARVLTGLSRSSRALFPAGTVASCIWDDCGSIGPWGTTTIRVPCSPRMDMLTEATEIVGAVCHSNITDWYTFQILMTQFKAFPKIRTHWIGKALRGLVI